MGEADFDSVMMIAGERSDIKIVMSSTPTGKRSKFYQACTDPNMHFTEHYHPSMHNPNWNEEMEAEFRSILTEQGYVHEVEAEFGTQDTGVFDKVKLDKAVQIYDYAYNPLNYYQENNIRTTKEIDPSYEGPDMMMYSITNKAPYNPFRTMGVDFDKYQASSSLLILEYNIELKKFMVLKRYEMPRAEYSYDNAVNKIIELNEIYNPSFIYCDRGSGEYCIERLHIYGDEHPESGLKNKVKGWSFSNKVDVQNPITGEVDKKPMKPFMVSQLQIMVERENLILSPYDETLYKQLIDYEVEKIGANGIPVFTSKEEHFVDALGLANLAMVIEFKELAGVLEDVKMSSKIEVSRSSLARPSSVLEGDMRSEMLPEVREYYENTDFSEYYSERQHWIKTDFKAMREINIRNTRTSFSRNGSFSRGGFGR